MGILLCSCLEQLQDVARANGCALSDAVSALGGKAGTKIGAFLAGIDVLREQTQGKSLRDTIVATLEHSGLLTHYKADREGADRLENLAELVNAAESFVSLEGFGRDAVALPVDELGQALTQSPASQGLDLNQPVLDIPAPDAETGETLSPLAAFLTLAMGFIGLPRHLAEFIGALNLSPLMLIVLLIGFFVVLGCFLDGISMVVLTMAVLLPTVEKAGFDLIWFGIFIVLVVEMAQITPPVGFNLFVLQGLTKKQLMYLAKVAFPFFMVMVVMVFLTYFVPDIVLWMPRNMS